MKDSQSSVLQKYTIGSETTWEQVARRVAKTAASVESESLSTYYEDAFYNLLKDLKFVPGGSILANSGHGTQGLQNCFVLGVEDNIKSMAKLVHDSIMTTKFRGGIGIHIGSYGQPNYVRHKGATYGDGKALGPCAVLDMVSGCSRKLTTGNKARRGAFMFSMDWRHSDIWEFIQAKTEATLDAQVAKAAAQGGLSETEFNEAWVETHLSPKGRRERRWYNANISVMVDDEFFEYLHLANQTTYCHEDLAPEHLDGNPFTEDDQETLGVTHLQKAAWALKLWDQIADYAHRTADPGLLLVDNAKSKSPIKDFISTTNPCGEIWLPIGSSCNLGSIDVSKFVRTNWRGVPEIDWIDLGEHIRLAVRFLDDVLDASNYATYEQLHNITQKFRQVGLGIMGWADLLNKLEIPYDSQKHLDLIDEFGEFFATAAYETSQALAVEKGECGIWPQIAPGSESFPNGSPNPDFDNGKMRRNSTVLSIAPTGSIAQLAGCSWAFEPHFGLVTWKQVFVDASAMVQNWVPIVIPAVANLGLSESDLEIVQQTGSILETNWAKENPERALSYKIAREITPEWHIRVQAQWQRWIDSSISKTINLPAEATHRDIKAAYLLADELGLKGITVYRSGTLESEPVKVGNSEATQDQPEATQDQPEATQGCRSGSCDIH
jgi:ribonucleoside-diphosphate reductase alpha chain